MTNVNCYTQIRVALEKVHAGEFFPVKEDDENYTSEEERMINLKYSSNNNNAIKRSSMAPPEMLHEASVKTTDAINTASAVLLPLKPSSSTSSISHEVSIHETSDTEADDTEPENVEEKKKLNRKDDDPNV